MKHGSYNNSIIQLVKNTGLLSISSFASKILVFLLVPLYTSVLSTEEYGAFDLMQTTVLLLLPILSINIYDAVMRFIMDENYDKKVVVSIGVKYVILSIVFFTILTVLNAHFAVVKNIVPYKRSPAWMNSIPMPGRY